MDKQLRHMESTLWGFDREVSRLSEVWREKTLECNDIEEELYFFASEMFLTEEQDKQVEVLKAELSSKKEEREKIKQKWLKTEERRLDFIHQYIQEGER